MTAATLWKEREAAEKCKQDKARKAAASLKMVVKAQMAEVGPSPPSVVSPPSAPNLTSLLTDHVSQDGEAPPALDISTKAAKPEQQADDATKSPTKKKTTKSKSTKEDKSAKCNCSGSVLKKSSCATSTLVGPTPMKEFKQEHIFNEAGLELKGEDKYGAYVEQIRTLLENIQLVNPCTIMHAADKMGGAKPLGSKTKMSTNMAVFLACALVGSNANAFKPKKNNTKKQGCKGKDEPDTLDPRVYPTLVFSSDVDPDIIILHVTHKFC